MERLTLCLEKARARREAARRPVPRPRPLQGGQRRLRTRRRRQPSSRRSPGGFSQCVRDDDTVARVGGDEFVVLLPEIARSEDATTVARKLLDAVAQPFELDGPARRPHDEHRRLRLPGRRAGRGVPPAQRRLRDDAREGEGSKQLPALHSRADGRGGPAAHAPGGPPAGDREGRARSALPAGAVACHGTHRRAGGARPLAAPEQGADHAERLSSTSPRRPG